MRRALLASLLLVYGGMAASGAAPPACPPPAALDIDTAPLPHLAAVLRPGGRLTMLAIGSGAAISAAQPAASPVTSPVTSPAPPAAPPPLTPVPRAPVPHAALSKGAMPKGAAPKPLAVPPPAPAVPAGLPWQTAMALEAATPGLKVAVTAIGRRGLTAEGMLPALRDELRRHPYRLVLWLTGTVDAVNGVPPDDFYEALAEGVAAAAAAGADMVLIDPQYSRFLEGNANLVPYLSAMQAAGALPGVVLFHRFDIMRAWSDVEEGAIDLERTPKAERPAAAARLHACLGKELARMLLLDIGAR